MKKLTLKALQAMATIRETEYSMFDQVTEDYYSILDRHERTEKPERDENDLDLTQLIGD